MRKTSIYSLVQGVRVKTKVVGASLVLAVTGISGVPLFLSQTASALSNSVYVSPAGIGSVCSSAHPCQTIAAGLAAVSSGGTVHVAAGTYSEAVIITKPVTIAGAGQNTIITPPASFTDGGTIVDINATDVVLKNLSINGPFTAPSCADTEYGVYFEDGADATIKDSWITNIKNSNSALLGCQQGIAVRVGQQSAGINASATLTNNVITGYQKGGIVVDNSGSSATIKNNTITGMGPTGVIAQNGIQISRGATATVKGNTVSGNSYTGADIATGILLFGAANSTTTGPNTISGNQIGVWLDNPGQMQNLNLNGVSGNLRDAVADVNDTTDSFSDGQWPTPTTTYADSSISGIADTNGNDILKFKGDLHVYDYDVFKTIQGALDGVAANGKVKVDNGTYTENLNITKPGILLKGESKNGVKVNNAGANTFGDGVSVEGLDGVSIEDMTFNVASGANISYHFTAYQDTNLTLQDLVFNGPGRTATNAGGHGIGGVDINSSSNVTLNKVDVSNYSKNGISFTAAYTSDDVTTHLTHDVSFHDISSNNNAWVGLVFYTIGNDHLPSSVGGESSITGVTFSDGNVLKNNGQAGLYIEGDSDSAFGSHATPRFTVTGPAGALLKLGGTQFSGNTQDVVNYQTSNILALRAPFNGKKGNDMNQAKRDTEENLIFDHQDLPSLGSVIFFNTPIGLTPKDGAKVTNIQSVDWTDVPGAIGYEYESSHSDSQHNDGSFTNPVYTSGVLATSQIPTPGTPPGTYYWNVRAVFASGINGPWTDPSKFIDK